MEKIKSLATDHVVLENERSQGVTKQVNELSTGKFFKYLYAKSMFKMFGLNLLMCLFLIPMVILYYRFTLQSMSIANTIPYNGSLGIGFAFWKGASEYAVATGNSLLSSFWLWAILGICATSFAFAGGICVIRNAFWTGELSVSKNFYKGIYQCGLVAFVGFALIGGAICGIVHLNFVMADWSKFLAVVVNIVLIAATVFLAIFVFVLTSVESTYRQPFGTSVKTSFAIIKKYFISTVLNFVMALIPIALVLWLINSALIIIVIVLALMIGMYYIVLVWQTHMMKVFSIYHPVEKIVTKRKKHIN